MGSYSKNYEAINLTGGTYNASVLGNGITANTVHQIYALTSGSITITAMGGGTFTWVPAAANIFIDVVPSSVTVNSGTFVGFRVKNMGLSYTPNTYNG
jgi:hypothetical protein